MSMLEHAQHLAVDLGYPILPLRPRSKLPMTAHGVKDATTDERRILHWFEQDPDANIGVATGLPGPTVLDIDQMGDAAFLLAQLQHDHPPEVATARGRHLYYHGLEQGTISFEFGELRGTGSYVVAPPSVHPDGSMYVWLLEPVGRVLPVVPVVLTSMGKPAGVGEMPARTGKVGHGARHDHLKDMAVRLARSGVTDPVTLERMLRAEYLENCEHEPPPRRDEFAQLAKWAANTRIANRERLAPVHTLRPSTATGEHRQIVDSAGGWTPLSVASVHRYGNRLGDALHIHLDDGTVIDFPRQELITIRGGWARAVVAATDGTGHPPAMKDSELLDLYRSLCVLAGKSEAQLEAEEHADLLAELFGICEPLLGHTTQDAVGRYRLIDTIRTRRPWDPFDRQAVQQPVLIIDDATGDQYLRAGELMTWFRFRGAQINTREFRGRMAMIGLAQLRLNGREPPGTHAGRRGTNTALFYQLPGEDQMTDQPTPEAPETDPEAPAEPAPEQTEIPAEPADEPDAPTTIDPETE